MDRAAQCWGSGKLLRGIPCVQQRRQPEEDWVLIVIGRMHSGLHTQRIYQNRLYFALVTLVKFPNSRGRTQVIGKVYRIT